MNSSIRIKRLLSVSGVIGLVALWADCPPPAIVCEGMRAADALHFALVMHGRRWEAGDEQVDFIGHNVGDLRIVAIVNKAHPVRKSVRRVLERLATQLHRERAVVCARSIEPSANGARSATSTINH